MLGLKWRGWRFHNNPYPIGNLPLERAQALYLGGAWPFLFSPPEPKTGIMNLMSIDRKASLTGQSLRAMIERDIDACASLACEGMSFTPEEEAVFAEMASQGLSYDARIDYLNTYLARTAPALAAE